MLSRTLTEKLNQDLENVGKLETTIWLSSVGSLKEAAIVLKRKKGKLGVHVHVKSLMGKRTGQRCCPNQCPYNLSSAFERIATLIGKNEEPIFESLLILFAPASAEWRDRYIYPQEHDWYVLICAAWDQVLGAQRSLAVEEDFDLLNCREQIVKRWTGPSEFRGELLRTWCPPPLKPENPPFFSEADKERIALFVEQEVRSGFSDEEEIITRVAGWWHSGLMHRASKEAPKETSNQTWFRVKMFVTRMTEDSIECLRREEQEWVDPTDNDRLDWVFDYLEETGIAARQNYWCCQTCANAGIQTELRDSDASEKPYVGFVYYDQQSLEAAMAGAYFSVAFGAYKQASKEAEFEYVERLGAYDQTHDGQPVGFYDVNVETYRASQFHFIPVASPDLNARRVAARFMDAAILAGLEPIWNGAASLKIQLKVKWEHRRSTSCEFKPDGAPDLSHGLYRPLGPEDNPDFYTTVQLTDDT